MGKIEKKMADFSNHQRFSLRCLSLDLIPVSIRLRSTSKTPKGKQIIKKVERALLNERIRSINNTLSMLEKRRDTCIFQLEEKLDRESMEECRKFIKIKREARHRNTLDRQRNKLERLCQKNRNAKSGHSNIQHGDHSNKVNKNTGQRNDTATPVQEERSDIKWVRNISSTPLTEAQIKLLSHGPNYAVVPKNPLTMEYIAAIEKACPSLQPGKAEELRGEVKANIKKMQLPKQNLTKEEHKALEELKKDKTRMILTADKGVSIVVLDREEYIRKADELLSQSSYKKISTDPTNRYKSKLLTLLKKIKTEGGMDDVTYRRLYPTWASPPKSYRLPKVHKSDMPLRPIVSSIGSVTYETSKELSRILKPLVGRSPHHVQNNQEFLKQLEDIQMGPDDIIMSYDVKALFTSVPIKPALMIIQKLLEEDHTLPQRTTMTVKNITCLLEFCLSSTYFTFQEKFYE